MKQTSYEQTIRELARRQYTLMKLETLILPLNIKLTNVHFVLITYNSFSKILANKDMYDNNKDNYNKACNAIFEYLDKLDNLLNESYKKEFNNNDLTNISKRISPLINIPKVYQLMTNRVSFKNAGVYKVILNLGVNTVDYLYVLFKTHIIAPFIKDENEYKQIVNSFNQCMKANIDPLINSYNEYITKYNNLITVIKMDFKYLNQLDLVDKLDNLNIDDIGSIYNYLESIFTYYDINVDNNNEINKKLYDLNMSITYVYNK